MSDLAGLRFDHVEGVLVVTIGGEVDLSNADDLMASVADAIGPADEGAVLDLSDTRYLDSSGVRAVFDLAGRLQARRQQLRLVVADDAIVRRVLVLTKLDAAVPLHRSVTEAVEAVLG